MGCRGTQTAVVFLTLFNFISLIFSGILFALTVIVSIAIHKGYWQYEGVFTYNAYLFNRLTHLAPVFGQGATISLGIGIAMAISLLAVLTSLYGFILLCCRCKRTPKATKTYTVFVGLNNLFHIILLVTAVIILSKVRGSIRPALERLRAGISIEGNDIDGIYLNRNGQLFLDIQRGYGCCGVDSPMEWGNNVEWFRNKYVIGNNMAMSGAKAPMFPCTEFSELSTVLDPCGENPQPDCTTAKPITLAGCASPLEFNIYDSLRCFVVAFAMICGVQVFGLIAATVYNCRVKRSARIVLNNLATRNSSSRVSCTSTQMLMPQYLDRSISEMGSDDLAQMCFEIIAKNNISSK